ncbi:helix-turn-helix transcriptional regulator [Corynebacterium choanae]|uniref:WYL domain-containing protein n=1 Tax=Corynebacterium choanae TaxID=1862358 RepID=A0A3G6J6W3_9CORY|nr:WYL domain-containing protein [Corynebacterium choanae]AZA13562.1 hypothetical protein CCHOA_05810 [Corynebacterium choanae]
MNQSILATLTRQAALVCQLARTKHEDVALLAVSQQLDVSQQVLREDLERLKFCGLAEGGVDPQWHRSLQFNYEPGSSAVTVQQSLGLDRPLRLSREEATSLILLLQQLQSIPHNADAAAITGALEKLQHATKNYTGGFAGILGEEDESQVQASATIDEALTRQRAVKFTYRKPGSAAGTSRTVSVAYRFTHDLFWYLAGFDHDAQQPRIFRFDRIDDIAVSDVAIDPRAASIELNPQDPFSLNDAASVRVRIHQSLLWISRTEPVEILSQHDEQFYDATIRYHSMSWLVNFIVGHAGNIVALDPLVAQQVIEQAKAGLTHYVQQETR